ncbi:MAG: alpha/beta fold hydrolase [Actinomycetales bacterium]
MSDHLLDGIEAVDLDTDRLKVRVLRRTSDSGGLPLILIHGNCSSSLFYQRLMLDLPHDVRPIAVDLRGFGGTEAKPVDATRGLRDFSDDVWASVDALGLDRVALFGWSMGGGVVMQAIIDAPDRVTTATLQNPVSPYGFGGTKGRDGELTFPDGAGAGAGGANPRFIELVAGGDADGVRGDDGAPESASPRATLRGFYIAPTPEPYPDEDMWLASMLTTVTGEGNYPGDAQTSPNWPGAAPGKRGVLNAMAPTHLRLDALVDVEPKPAILWIRGEADQIVSDTSFFDLATLGSLGYVPGWPGQDEVPPQPMVTQTRAVLDGYAAAGGHYTEVALPGVGHSPHLEAEEKVRAALVAHLRGNG